MIELPEAINLAKQINENLKGKKVARVLPPTKVHKFCWFSEEPEFYNEALEGKAIVGAEGFGIYVEMSFDQGKKLCFNDGINIRLMNKGDKLKDYQLLIEFEDETMLVFTVAMYGAIVLHNGDYDNEYYLKSKEAITPFDEGFDTYFEEIFSNCKPSESVKAFLATKQRFPGIANGTLQDILYRAKIHPKRRISTLNETERANLLSTTKKILKEITDLGGRDTEKDIWGKPLGYHVQLSKKTYPGKCQCCGDEIKKETYLGGSIYYCPTCQKIE